jgi:hypothetical protein
MTSSARAAGPPPPPCPWPCAWPSPGSSGTTSPPCSWPSPSGSSGVPGREPWPRCWPPLSCALAWRRTPSAWSAGLPKRNRSSRSVSGFAGGTAAASPSCWRTPPPSGRSWRSTGPSWRSGKLWTGTASRARPITPISTWITTRTRKTSAGGSTAAITSPATIS